MSRIFKFYFIFKSKQTPSDLAFSKISKDVSLQMNGNLNIVEFFVVPAKISKKTHQ